MNNNLFLIWIALILLIQGSCKKSSFVTKSSNPLNYQEYISAFSPSNVKSSDPIKVCFVNKAVEADNIGKEVDPALFRIKPELKGIAIWENQYTISFQPDQKSLAREMDYHFETDINKIFKNVPDSLGQFVFKFQFLPVSVQMEWDFPRPDDQYENRMMIEGHMSLSEALENVNQLIKAKDQAGAELEVQVKLIDGMKNNYDVIIHKIVRTEDDHNVVLEWQTNPDNQSTNQELSVVIPGKNKFVVTGIKEDKNDNRCLMLYFSDELEKNQEFRGLIQVNLDSVKCSLVAEKDIIHVSFDTDIFRSGKLQVSNSIKDRTGRNLSSSFVHYFDFKEEKPQLKEVYTGTILPSTGKIIFPFEAINLNKVDVEIFKLFSNNILYNIHLNDYSGSYMLNRLGRVIHQQTIELNLLNEESNKSKWVYYGLDISKMITADPGAMYEVRIIFRPQYSDYQCTGKKLIANPDAMDHDNQQNDFHSFWSDYGYLSVEGSEADINEPEEGVKSTEETCYDDDNPCCISYYNSDHFIRRNILISNLALIVKSSSEDSESFALAYDVLSAKPISGVNIKLFDNQLQEVGNSKTDGSGTAKFNSNQHVRYAIANLQKNYAYLKLDPSKSLTTSEFDIDGISAQHGIKASIYTERGIWRPGDTMHLQVILHQDSKNLPETFPVLVECSNPKGQIVFIQKMVKNLLGLYAMDIPTKSNWMTGNYDAKIICGASIFNKKLQIESIKPNRFKFEWKFDENKQGVVQNANLTSSFLHGAPASNKKITVEAFYREVDKVFPKYKNYDFSDIRKKQGSDKIELLSGSTSSSGMSKIDLVPLSSVEVNGILSCTLVSKIMDDGGDISTDYFNKDLDMHKEYIGIKLPDTYYKNYYSGDEVKGIDLICLTKDGSPIANRELNIDVKLTNWDWWYEIRRNESWMSNNFIDHDLFTKKVKTDANGKASFNIKVERYKNYYFTVSSTNSDQTAGAFFYTGWSSENGDQKDFVQTLNFSPDKEKYQIGEKANFSLPGASNGTYLIHIIRDNKIIRSDIVKPSLPKTEYNLPITSEMFPNAYVDVTLLQGIANKTNDLPLRLYGVSPVMVENENLRLKPIITMSDKIRPDEDFKVEISEAGSKIMAYQLMLVDEGLLNLTRFKTPDPYGDMFQKEAMRMLTWDNYDQFIGNEIKTLQRIFGIGGDQSLSAEELAKQKRFKAAVLMSGPQYLAKGEKKIHHFKIENYIGSMRVMVIANNQTAFGAADKTVIVRNELAMQIGFPRVASVTDKISIPVTIFKYEDGIKSADINLKVTGPCTLSGGATKSVSFKDSKESTVWFDLMPTGNIGQATIEGFTQSGSFKSTSKVEFFIDNPNPVSTKVSSIHLESGASKEIKLDEYGMKGTQKVFMEVSSIGSIQTEENLKKLIDYPYGCVEQTISSVLPQLFLENFIELDVSKVKELKNNIAAGISKLQGFQCSNGGLSYWPGSFSTEDYCSAYAYHFLMEAKKKGYQVPDAFLSKLGKYLSAASNAYQEDKYRSDSKYIDFIQAYRLYVLSLASSPEWGAMNRLRLKNPVGQMTRWMLAGAYAVGGKTDIAKQIIANLPTVFASSDWSDNYYGSDIRDEAFVSMVLSDLGNKELSQDVIQDAVSKLNKNPYPNTQELSTTMLALGKIYKNANLKSNKLSCNYSWNGKSESISTNQLIYRVGLNSDKTNSLLVSNTSAIPLTFTIYQFGKELPGSIVNKSNGLRLDISYLSKSGQKIDLNNLKQGDNIKALIRITNTGTFGYLKNLALTAVFPSGFEIENTRIGGISNLPSRVNYADYRDDRIMYYFDLDAGKSLDLDIPLTAAYAGTYLRPLLECESMYKPAIQTLYRSGIAKISVR